MPTHAPPVMAENNAEAARMTPAVVLFRTARALQATDAGPARTGSIPNPSPVWSRKATRPKAQTGKRFRALGLLQTDFLRTQGIGKPLLFVRKHGQAAREACELRFQDLFVRLAEQEAKNAGISASAPYRSRAARRRASSRSSRRALERFPFQLCPVPPIKRLGIGDLRHIEETFHFPHGVMMDGLSLPSFHACSSVGRG